MRYLSIFLCCLWPYISTHGQQNISEFRSLKAQAPVPTYLKNLSSTEGLFDNKNKALAYNDYMLKVLLKEGSYVFNDPISNHLNQLKTKFLNDFDGIQFLLVKSNVPAVFHNHEKLVFLTTGLIASLENEAELIFFMGKGKAMLRRITNEANRYSFDINLNLNGSYKSIFQTDEIIAEQLIIQDLSINNDSNKQALQLLIKLGLNPNASITALQKLETSKFVVESSPINTEDLAISGIKFEAEDLEDNYQPVTIKESNLIFRSYHEGVQNQIKKLETAFDEVSESNNVFLTNNEDFDEIKTLARFQLINHELTRGNIKKAIYYSLICKRTHPDNYFVNYALVRGFYALSACSNSKKWSKIKNKDRRIKGDYSTFNNFINKLTKEELNLITLTLIDSIQANFPEDHVIKQYQKEIQKDIARFTRISSVSFISKPDIIEITNELAEIDTINLSRTERIRAKQRLRAKEQEVNSKKANRSQSSEFLRPAFIASLDSTKLSKMDQFLNGGSDSYYNGEDEIIYADLEDGTYINPSKNYDNTLLINSDFIKYKSKSKSIDVAASISKSKYIEQSIGKKNQLFDAKFCNPLQSESVSLYNQKSELVRFVAEMNLIGNNIKYKFSNQDIVEDILKAYEFEHIATLSIIHVIGKDDGIVHAMEGKLDIDGGLNALALVVPSFMIGVFENKIFQRSSTIVNCSIYNIEEGLHIQDYNIKRRIKPTKVLLQSELFNLQSTLSNN